MNVKYQSRENQIKREVKEMTGCWLDEEWAPEVKDFQRIGTQYPKSLRDIEETQWAIEKAETEGMGTAQCNDCPYVCAFRWADGIEVEEETILEAETGAQPPVCR